MLKIIDRAAAGGPAVVASGIATGPTLVRRGETARFTITCRDAAWRPFEIDLAGSSLHPEDWRIVQAGITRDVHPSSPPVRPTQLILVEHPIGMRVLSELAHAGDLPALRIGDYFWIDVQYVGGEEGAPFVATLEAAVAWP